MNYEYTAIEFIHGTPAKKAQLIVQALDRLWSFLQGRPCWTEAEQVVAIKCLRVYDTVSSRWFWRMDRIEDLSDDQRLSLARRQALQKMLDVANSNPKCKRILLTDQIN